MRFSRLVSTITALLACSTVYAQSAQSPYPTKTVRIVIPFGTGGTNLMARWLDRKSTRLNSSHIPLSRMPSSA